MEDVQSQQDLELVHVHEQSAVFVAETLSEGFFLGQNKINCAAPYNHGRQMVYGTDDGVYMANLGDQANNPAKVLALANVVQIDVLEACQLLVVLSERQVITFPLEALNPHDPTAGLAQAKRISSHTTFFKVGHCLGKNLLCVVKASPLSSTSKVFEAIDRNMPRPVHVQADARLRIWKEFYIPVESSSVHFMKTVMCVGCKTGFEIVDLQTLDTQSLLDPSDAGLEFTRERDGLKPMAIYRIGREFLLCYNEFAFYVTKAGGRARPDFMVRWEGKPTGFAFKFPYVLALEPGFIEVWNVETGALAQMMQGNNLRLLFADMAPSTSNGNGSSSVLNVNAGGVNSVVSGVPSTLVRDKIVIASDDRIMMLRLAEEVEAEQQSSSASADIMDWVLIASASSPYLRSRL